MAAVIQLNYRQHNDVMDGGNLIGLQQRGGSVIGLYFRHNWPHLLLEKTPCTSLCADFFGAPCRIHWGKLFPSV